ncbi:hypothetical protein NC77_17905 [Janthinobacterium lividum]|uniref:glycoside hydrolase family 19 protein n=1 Tax=Janthinobacterium lividum TaxID=29581 RepID=UPI000538744F|nr:glycoside hydrolase family 19 protein [Janthinobacterium lividum]KHA77507.1 hypothetical protein NC77_17905 [Janthinobacterium lividum]
MQLTLAQLQSIMPNARAKAGIFLPALNAAMLEFGISTPARQAAWLATVGVESGSLQRVEESLNYRADRLLVIFGKYFTPALASAYAGKPEMIANRVYANRMGNGNEASGDGWRRRGAGFGQITGTDNQRAVAIYFDIPMARIADWLKTPGGACRSAGWFAKVNNLNAWADKGDFDGYCDVWNRGRKTAPIGDAIGYAERLAMYSVALQVLK